LIHYLEIAYSMRWRIAAVVLSALSITAIAITSLQGGESMTQTYRGAEGGIGLPPSDISHSGTLETATFALG